MTSPLLIAAATAALTCSPTPSPPTSSPTDATAADVLDAPYFYQAPPATSPADDEQEDEPSTFDPGRPHFYLKGGGLFNFPFRFEADGSSVDFDVGLGFFAGAGVEAPLGRSETVLGRVEFEYARSFVSSDTISTGGFSNVSSDALDLTTDDFVVQSLLVFNAGGTFRPFAGVGVGLQRAEFEVDGFGSEDDTALLLRGTVGASIMLSERSSLDVFGRYSYGFFESADLSGDEEGTPIDFASLGVGLTFRF